MTVKKQYNFSLLYSLPTFINKYCMTHVNKNMCRSCLHYMNHKLCISLENDQN